MFIRLGICLLTLTLFACAGTTSIGNGDGNGIGGANSSVGGAAGNNSVGGGAGVANNGGRSSVGGSSSNDNCPGTTVNFQVVPAPNSPTQWCLGMPGSCGGQTMTILDASGALGLSSYCQMACETCTMNLCPPLACLLPVELTNAGSNYSWDGTYVISSNCGSSATACMAKRCAAPGRYQFRACGFANPDPTSTSACSTAPSTTTQTCTQVTFDYPATTPVVVTMPLLP